MRLKKAILSFAVAQTIAGRAVASELQTFSLVCPGAAAGQSRPLQFDVHVAEGWYASGLEGGEATYANRAEMIPDSIWLWLSGTVQHRRGVEWRLKAGHRLYICQEIGFRPLMNASNPF